MSEPHQYRRRLISDAKREVETWDRPMGNLAARADRVDYWIIRGATVDEKKERSDLVCVAIN